ncbi:MAG: bifunctional diaminohydroxyphosphoribosylaminopyrimidine deaminase/5-amino-6-(5-phosphoribosylamino)uracil reductase RibD [Deltaproteobacteria bacterium]|nr:bifunctional diaminohydroxyphosphoribosylaminopyrimidine deaminase/5-amino-6-(5-phosphoribosylamino)uracil reductase RibD [Deltaproteobacteria bacterium]
MAARTLHEERMRMALRAAELGRGRTRPNPIVGCVIAKGAEIVSVGHHERAGGPHAEIVALQKAGARARGADVYVTLEPHDHHGKTPPCTEALIAAGVKRVFVGVKDPNPLVSGRGIARLRKAGIAVELVLEAECAAANEAWFKFIQTGRPWVVLKAAATLDGALATAAGDSRWVTGEAARAEVHKLRDSLDAIVVGIGTALADDPRLNARLPEHPEKQFKGRTIRGVQGRDPVRVVVDTHARLPPEARMLTQRSEAPTLVAVGPKAPVKRLRALEAAGAEIVRCELDRGGRVSLESLLAELAKRDLVSLLVEGGAALHGAFLESGLWDELLLFLAPKLAGKGALTWAGFPGATAMAQARPVVVRSVERIGVDWLVRARRG